MNSRVSYISNALDRPSGALSIIYTEKCQLLARNNTPHGGKCVHGTAGVGLENLCQNLRQCH
jgi:hypothetical protein